MVRNDFFRDSSSGYEFTAGKLRLARRWRFYPLTGDLLSLTNPYLWTPGINQARCPNSNNWGWDTFQNSYLTSPESLWVLNNQFSQIDPKCESRWCSCGFYGYFNTTAESSLYQHGGDITGVIDGWGKCRVGTLGAQVEKARIVALAPVGASQTLSPTWYQKILGRKESGKLNEQMEGLRAKYPEATIYSSLSDALLDFPLGEI